MIAPQDKLIVDICGYGTNGEGVAKYQNYTIFVPFVAQGERVSVVVDYAKNNIAYASCLEVIQRSDRRVLPPCKYFGKCGGCQLQHLDYSEQLTIKRDIVVNNLRKIGGIDCEVLPVVSSPLQYGYRNKISLPVSGKTGNVHIGMYKSNTHQVVDVDKCSLAGKWCDDVVAIVRQFVNDNGLPPYNERRHTGLLRHIVARYIDGQLLVTLVANCAIRCNLRPLYKSLCNVFGQVGLFVNINTMANNVIMGQHTQHLFGLQYIKSNTNAVTYFVQTDSFFQVNDKVKDMLYSKAKELLYGQDTEVFIDCFSGVGLLTAAMYDRRYDSYSIEIQPSSVEDAKRMKEVNGFDRLTTICGDVTVELPKLIEQTRGKETCMIVDPPRKGLGETICNTIIINAPDRLVYISCDSATLARDLSILQQVYTIQRVEPYDLFPNTRHVETLVLLSK